MTMNRGWDCWDSKSFSDCGNPTSQSVRPGAAAPAQGLQRAGWYRKTLDAETFSPDRYFYRLLAGDRELRCPLDKVRRAMLTNPSP